MNRIPGLNQLNPLEREEAAILVQWLRVQGLHFHHSPNETGSSPEARRRAVRMKREGTSAGFPDYTILIPHNRSITGEGFVLYIELKRRKGGTVSPLQKSWIAAFNELDVVPVAAYVAHGAGQAIDIISRHLKSADTDTSPF